MSDNQEVEYEKEEGFVRLNLRRPVNLYVPSEYLESYDPSAASEEPNATLELDWVYGYRGRDCRNNMFLLASGEIIYFTAAVAVIYNPESHTQRHYLHHTDDIKCLRVHPNGKIIGTGQIKGKNDNLPHVCIWDSETLEPLNEFGRDTFSRGVACLAFSNDGKIVAVVDDAPEPILSLWNWKEETELSEIKASSAVVIGVSFTNESPSRIVTSGKNHLAFWNIGDDWTLDKDMAIFGKYEKPKYVTAVISLHSGNVVSGDTNGNILLWKNSENTVERAIKKVHKGAIFCIALNFDKTLMSSASDDKIVLYDEDLNPTGKTLQLPEKIGAGRALRKASDIIYVGTTHNGIVKVSPDNQLQSVTEGHMDELWGLAAHPTENHFLVAGQDGRVIYRDATTNKVLGRMFLELTCQCADISPDGTMTAIGGDKGKWMVIDNGSYETIHEGVAGDEFIQVIRFSPDSTRLVLGSRDNTAYIYDIDKENQAFSKKGECEGHSSFITHLDWSEDGEILRTNSGDYEVLHWKVEDMSRLVEKEDFRDVTWATNNCILSFNSLGIWPPGVDGTHINSCNKAVEKALLASGDDDGILKLFAYPSSVQNAKHHKYTGHSSHITNVVFLKNDSTVITTGGRDFTAMKWKVIDG